MFLNVHSCYSLRYGTMSIEKLVTEAAFMGIREMALTDINNSTGILEFFRECKAKGIKAIGGIEFRREGRLLYTGIAQNKEGMKELNDFLTGCNLEKRTLPDRPIDFKHAYVLYTYGKEIFELRENEFLGIRAEQLHLLYNKDLGDLKKKLVVWHPVTVNSRTSYRLHQYLRAIDGNTVLSKIGTEESCSPREEFLPPGELKRLYAGYPFIVENTEKLLSSCCLDYSNKTRRNKRSYTGSRQEDQVLLEKLAWAGLEDRYEPGNKEAAERLKKELKVIAELDFMAYFLITWDIIQYSKSKGYYHVGRGSGANSIVAFCLRITDVDPLELKLYFERFLNKHRSSPPDFDIDYSWDEREDVQRYIFEQYGKAYTALLGTMSTFKDKSVFREIGKAMGLPKEEIDSFTDPTQQGKHLDNPVFKRIMNAYDLMKDMPNQRSIHAGGVLISEEPITYYTALDLPPKDLPTVQWDMYEAEAIGFDKFDILSQRGIGHIKEAVELIEQNTGDQVDIHEVRKFMDDPLINARLRLGESIGCFYIESPAMRQLLSKLECEDYLTLVAASSIIRPGVAQSGMMKTYIYNYHHRDQIKYLHPIMKQELEDTFGVMVYQEDVIKVCYSYGGLDLADADILRRGMSGKYRSKAEFDRLVESFFINARNKGYDEAITAEIWRQVASFAGYSFSKAHSASFAVESYQSLFLKTHYPMEFMVAVLNNYGGFYQRWVYVHELKKTGARVHLPCVNHSDTKVNISGQDVYMGFIGINGLESRFIQLIPQERERNGRYTDLEDFILRTGITLQQCILLIRTGALRDFGKSKKILLWEVYNYLGTKTPEPPAQALFKVKSKSYVLPELESSVLEDAYHELELLGYPLSMEMFDLLKTSYRGDVMAAELKKHTGKTVKMLGQYVCEKTVRTKNNKKMWFGTFLDVKGDFFDTTHFPAQAPVYPFKGKGCYLILGKVTEDFGCPSVEVLRFEKLPIADNPVLGDF
ncbi:DNA polymerase III subunit alpha [Pedobacter nutrimenti]|uniref:DNA-directed DNA polymerase n=1 Tax=Pedobacter nutrimenti TaxID=1241337 RepID=A0A318UB49_9SPHI|nr:DNA polymerase III subunit alpha [Pedobacter nutrimenti]PYF69376.1 DNA polymerase-3 subunit alpha [Pedobacter nutrimenti]